MDSITSFIPSDYHVSYRTKTLLQSRDTAQRRVPVAAQRETHFGGGNTGCFFLNLKKIVDKDGDCIEK